MAPCRVKGKAGPVRLPLSVARGPNQRMLMRKKRETVAAWTRRSAALMQGGENSAPKCVQFADRRAKGGLAVTRIGPQCAPSVPLPGSVPATVA